MRCAFRYTSGYDSDCCGANTDTDHTYCADGYSLYYDGSSDKSTCEDYRPGVLWRSCCVPDGSDIQGDKRVRMPQL